MKGLARATRLAAFVAASLATSRADADVVVPKNGQRVEGTVLEEKPQHQVVVMTAAGKKTIAWPKVERVEREPAKAAEAAATPPATPPGDPAEGVKLRDGTQLPGTVDDVKPGATVSLRHPDGRADSIPWTTVARVTLAPGHEPPASLLGTAGGGDAGAASNDPDARRRAWMDCGGLLLGFDAGALGIFLAGKLGGSNISGGGGGADVHATLYYLNPPDPSLPGALWWGGRVSGGVEFSAAAVQIGSTSSSALLLAVPGSVGGQVGLGSYRGDEWHGFMFGLDYKPTYQYTSANGHGSGEFNAAGFQVTMDFTTLRAALHARTLDPNWRASFFALPPVNGLPFVGIAGFAAAWY